MLFVIVSLCKCKNLLLKYKELYPDNFIDAGIAEEHAAVMSAGMALSNKKVVLLVFTFTFTF